LNAVGKFLPFASEGSSMSMRIVTALLFSLAIVSTVHAAAPHDQPMSTAIWNQWRGPTRDGRVTGKPWPDKLQGNVLQPLWRVAQLSPSYSGPIVSDTLVFTTETKDKTTEVVSAVDRQTGEARWRAEWPGAIAVPFFAKANGDWIRATPAYDGEFLYVAGMRDVLVCLEADTGREVWRLDFIKELGSPVPEFGFVSSPLVDGDALYVQAGASVVRIDKRTGKIAWRTLQDGGGMFGSAFSSPIVADLHGRRQLVVQTRQKLAGISPESGEVLWSQVVPSFRGMNILTPTVLGDAIFTSSYQNKSWLYSVALKQDTWSVSEAWNNKAQGYMSSPVVVDGYAYLHLGNERFTCIDLKSGERTWTSPPQGKYASLVVQEDRILALNEQGTLLLIKATPDKFELLDSRKVAEADTWAHLAIAGDELYIRELDALSAFRWSDE
jgi:outer membrane protein assembly factor BamB